MHKHTFIKSDKKGYEVCTECGTYHSTKLKKPDEIYQNYWGDGTGRSTLEQQCENFVVTDDCGISKIDRVMQFIPKRGKTFLEIGCSPGVLLDRMLDINYDTYGIEPCKSYIPFIVSKARGAYIAHGYFPDVAMTWGDGFFNCIAALDVAEHIEHYDVFFREVYRLLAPNGRAIIMSPIILDRDKLIKESDFLPGEHAWIWTEKFLDPYLKDIFREVKFTLSS